MPVLQREAYGERKAREQPGLFPAGPRRRPHPVLEAEGEFRREVQPDSPTQVEAGVMGFSPFRPTVAIRKLSLTTISRGFEFNPEGACISHFLWELAVLGLVFTSCFTAGVLGTSMRSASPEVSSFALLVSGGASC